MKRTKRFLRREVQLEHLVVRKLNAPESSLLAKLPTELVGQVLTYLPTASAASLNISSWYISRLIGTKYLEMLVTSDPEKLAFLNLLEHDMVEKVVCNTCKKLHRIRDMIIYESTGSKDSLPCLSDERMGKVTLKTHGNFDSTFFKMAVKHCRLSDYDYQTWEFLLLLLLESRINTPFSNQEAKFWIPNNSLFVRRRHTLHEQDTDAPANYGSICQHLIFKIKRPHAGPIVQTFYVRSYEGNWSIVSVFKAAERRNTTSELQKCQYCQLNIRLAFIAMVMIRWQSQWQPGNIWEEGLHSEECKAYISAFEYLPPSPVLADLVTLPVVEFRRGDISSVFQGRGLFRIQRWDGWTVILYRPE